MLRRRASSNLTDVPTSFLKAFSNTAGGVRFFVGRRAMARENPRMQPNLGRACRLVCCDVNQGLTTRRSSMNCTEWRLRVVLLAASTLLLGASALAKEQRITRDEVPKAVLSAFEEAYPKATIKGYARETEKGQTAYEIESVEGNTRRDITYNSDGKLISVEEAVGISDLPPGVKGALAKKFPDAKILRAERVMKGAVAAYEFRIEHEGTTTEIVFDAEGKELPTRKK